VLGSENSRRRCCAAPKIHYVVTFVLRSAESLAAYPSATEFESSWCELASETGAAVRTIGRSREGRPIRCFELGRSGGNVVLLTGLIHGVELIGSMALRAAVRALSGDLLANTRFVVVPIVNPDAFARNMDQLARGRRAWQRCNAAGVDLNRNFPTPARRRPRHPFAGSRFRLAPHYAGAAPFCEPETRALRDLVLSAPPALALGFHSFGELLLYPWGHTREPNPRRSSYEALGTHFVRALAQRPYAVRQACEFYPTAGDLDDWLDSSFGTLAFTVEVGQLDAGLLEPARWSNPFFWHNPRAAEATLENVVPGVIALLRAASSKNPLTDAGDSGVLPRRGLEIAAR
jgi:carboxypeptidase T